MLYVPVGEILYFLLAREVMSQTIRGQMEGAIVLFLAARSAFAENFVIGQFQPPNLDRVILSDRKGL